MSVHFVLAGGTGAATDNRCYIVTGAPGNLTDLGAAGFGAPSVGGDIDGVRVGSSWFPAHPGACVNVESSAAFSSGVTLASIADGRVRTATAGEYGVLRALTSSGGAGVVVSAVFTHGNKV